MLWLSAILIVPYFILLLKIYRGLVNLKPFTASSKPSLFISVVIACHNEEHNIPSLLSKLSVQNYPENLFEVIIIDDRSTDNTAYAAECFKGIKNLKIVSNSGAGKKQALRTGIMAAKGKLIITTDADCQMGKKWIHTIGSHYEINSSDLIICPVKLESTSGLFGKFQELEFLGLQGVTAGTSHSGEATMCNGANLAFSKDSYISHSHSLHDEINSGDDIFLLHSIKKEERPIISWLESPDALVSTKPSPTLLSFIRQRSRWILKSRAYNDIYTIILALVILSSIILELSCFIAGLFNPGILILFIIILIMKSIPDFLILYNTTGRYNAKNLMLWFLPAQILYPFYVLVVISCSLLCRDKKVSYPFPKET